MDDLKKLVRLNQLFDLYHPLLTDKQCQYFKAYYFNDSSLSEVATSFNVSRNAIYSQLSDIIKELESLENKLHLLKNSKKRKELIMTLKEEASSEQLVLLEKLEEIE